MNDNQNDLFLHFLAMSCKGQAAADMVVMNKFSSSEETHAWHSVNNYRKLVFGWFI